MKMKSYMNRNLIHKPFIEAQFPVSKLSKESYKERKAGSGQTLTGLGKWWGRKPLVLVRAIVLGLLLPVSSDPFKDRAVFLKLMTMDQKGLRLRRKKRITDEEFDALGYDDKMTMCFRPEEIDGPSAESWQEINQHLGTNAASLQELVTQLGERIFGENPSVGDPFCGGGSIPFEAARLGCDVYASDINPFAALLTWGALNIVGGSEENLKNIHQEQEKIFNAVDKEIQKLGFEYSEEGYRADIYLYCLETDCPSCRYNVPLLPNPIISEKQLNYAEFVIKKDQMKVDLEVKTASSNKELGTKSKGSVEKSILICPNCGVKTSIQAIRGDNVIDSVKFNKLSLWENEDIVPRHDDIYRERLYCIRWIINSNDKKGKNTTKKVYKSPTDFDLITEQKVTAFVQNHLIEWQNNGYVPAVKIEKGVETTRLSRERGWTHWHHLFNPRQLLINGLLLFYSKYNPIKIRIKSILGVLINADYNSKLARWNHEYDKSNNTFSNQALNTMFNYPVRGVSSCVSSYLNGSNYNSVISSNQIESKRAELIEYQTTYFITDPPYADAVNYHELADFFNVWVDKKLYQELFGEYNEDYRKNALKGDGEDFRKKLVDIYRNLKLKDELNGRHVIMFTHQNSAVWADLALIIWASNLQVTAAWTIQTETESALKKGNYVQGTVIMILRKRLEDNIGFKTDVIPEIKKEVKKQLDSMIHLDDYEDKNFTDVDYQLAAYAAALKVLTSYSEIEGINIEAELRRKKEDKSENQIDRFIQDAVRIACEYLIPEGFNEDNWQSLNSFEKFYFKGLELFAHGERRNGVFQELARGFALREYTSFFENTGANESLIKGPVHFKNSQISDFSVQANDFDSSITRHLSYAILVQTTKKEVLSGLQYLKSELKENYWQFRLKLIALLEFKIKVFKEIPEFTNLIEDCETLKLSLQNDSI